MLIQANTRLPPRLTSECPVMIGTVPVYDSVIHYQRDLATLSAQDFIDVIRMHAEDGVDFVTLHCGITQKTIEQIKKHKRKMNIVSLRRNGWVSPWLERSMMASAPRFTALITFFISTS